jgi:hypothetical protein
MNELQAKLKKTSQSLSILLKVFCVFMIIFTCAFVVASVLFPIIDATFTIDYSLMDLSAQFGSLTASFGLGEAIFITFAVTAACLAWIMGSAQKIFADTHKTGLPFTLQNVKRIKTVAILTIFNGLVTPFMFFLMTSLFAPGTDFDYSLDANGIVLGIIIYALSRIFQYGCQLQKFSDETL